MKVYTSDKIGFVELENFSGSDLTAINAARVSFKKSKDTVDAKDVELLNFLAKAGHHSPFEHIYFNFHVKAPIFVARQWFRHRIASYNEVSLRYTEATPEFFIPETKFLKGAFMDIYSTAMKEYDLIRRTLEAEGETPKRARELARAVLPMGTYTEFKFSCNLRALIHFIQLRSDSHAQPEIQEYANNMHDILASIGELVHSTEAFVNAGNLS